MHRGKSVILLMALVGCLLGWVSVSFSPWLSRHAIPLWGSAGVASIRTAPHVAALELRRRDRPELGSLWLGRPALGRPALGRWRFSTSPATAIW